MNIVKTWLAVCLLCIAASCGNSNNNNNTGEMQGSTPDTVGGLPAPSSNNVDMSNTQVDSLRRTTDVKTDTPPSMKPNGQAE